MNFIIRNLGWILLIIFFVFMLYLISNQNNSQNLNSISSNTGTLLGSSGGVSEQDGSKNKEIKQNVDLDTDSAELSSTLVDGEMNIDLVDNNKDDNKIEANKNNLLYSDEIETKEKEVKGTGGVINTLRNLFTIKKKEEFLDTDAKSGATVTNSGEVTVDLIDKVDSELQGDNKLKVMTFNDKIEKDDVINQDTFNKIKDTDEKEVGLIDTITKSLGLDKSDDSEDKSKIEELSQDDQEIEASEVEVTSDTLSEDKKNSLSSDIGQTYEVGVHSLKLNNAWFTKKLGIVYMGDKVEQLTPTNKYGCFKVKILSSKNEKNNGKIAWVCKYYMKNHKDSLYKYEGAAAAYNRSLYKKKYAKPVTKNVQKVVIPKVKVKSADIKMTEVGTMYSVKTHSLQLNNESFNHTEAFLLNGDKLEQLTKVNKAGCFKVSVYSSSNTKANNVGKRGWVCQRHLSY